MPAVAAAIGRAVRQAEAAARGELTAELVDRSGRAGARRLRPGGRERSTACARPTAARPARPPRRARRRAPATRCGSSSPALPSRACSRSPSRRTPRAMLDRVLVAMLALLAFASFEAVQPLSQAARELPATLAAGRRMLELTDREPAIVDPAEPSLAPAQPFAVALEGVTARYCRGGEARPRRLRSPARARRPRRARRPERRRQDHGRQPAPALPRPRGGTSDSRRPRPPRLPAGGRPPEFAVAGQDAHLF